MQAFLRPKLYAALAERYKGLELPPVDGLVALLELDYKLAEGVRRQAAEAFRSSAKFAGFLTSDGRLDSIPTAAPDVTVKPAATTDVPSFQSITPKANEQTITVPADFIVFKCKLNKTSKPIDLPLPPSLTRADVNRLYAFLLTQVDDAEVSGVDLRVTVAPLAPVPPVPPPIPHP